MKTKTPSLDQILEQLQYGTTMSENLEPYLTNNRNVAREAILDWAQSKAPEERPQTKYLGKHHSLIQGWNNAIKQYKSNLRAESALLKQEGI